MTEPTYEDVANEVARLTKGLPARMKMLVEEAGGVMPFFRKCRLESSQSAYHWVKGNALPNAKSLIRISLATGCSIDWLLGLDEAQKEASDA